MGTELSFLRLGADTSDREIPLHTATQQSHTFRSESFSFGKKVNCFFLSFESYSAKSLKLTELLFLTSVCAEEIADTGDAKS